MILKKYNKLGAMVPSLFALIYASYGMMVLSYNSLASGGLAICLLLLFYESNRWGKTRCILAGISLSVAVLANPYLSALYFIYAIVVMILHLNYRKKEKVIIMPYDMNSFIWVSVGIVGMVLLFFAYVFSHSTFEQIIQTLPKIVLGDPAHTIKSFYYLTGGYIARILVNNCKNYFVFIIDILMAVLATGYLFYRDREIYRCTYVGVQTIFSLILLMIYLIRDSYINHIMFVPNILVLALIFQTNDVLVKRVFVCIWIPGILYTYLEYLSSNTGFSGISAASCVATIGSILIIVFTLQETGLSRVCKIALCSFLFIAFISLLVLRISYVFCEEDGTKNLTETIEYGPCKGMVVNEKIYKYYNDIYEDTHEIRTMSADTRVLYISDKSLWLSGKQRCASYSPLCYSITSTDLLFDYYSEHPEKTADVVYIEKTYKPQIVERFATRLNMNIYEKKSGWILYAKSKR